MVSSGEVASDVEGVSLTHEVISTSVPLSEMREEVSHCVFSSDLEAWWSLMRGFDQLTHMLVISSSVRMLNGIQRTTSDLRPATSFHLVLVKMGTSPQDWFVCCDWSFDRAPSGTVVLFKVKLVLADPAGTYSGTVPASRIPTRCVGMGCFCVDSGVLMLSM